MNIIKSVITCIKPLTYIIWEEFCIYKTRYTSTKTRLKKHLFMIDERFQRYSHLPYQVANNDINCYTKISQNFVCGIQVCKKRRSY